jgi:hypothetical protein
MSELKKTKTSKKKFIIPEECEEEVVMTPPTSNESKSEEISQKINLYTNPEFLSAMVDAELFENSEIAVHYKELFCLQECSNLCTIKSITDAFERIKPFIENTLDEVLTHNKKRLCVLPKGHTGKCESEPKKILINDNETVDKILSSISLCIYTTPGDDDYVYKNRASRMFPIPLSKALEKKIRNKELKLRCAVPLCEYTTPFMMATAYIDWMCYTLNLSDISSLINPSPLPQHQLFITMLLTTHKTFLIGQFSQYNRQIFDSEGFTVCAVKRNTLLVKNMADITRDNRVNIDLDDIQMGHIQSRNDSHFTIRGANLLMMTREGNRIIGEESFIDNIWIEKLKKIVRCY